MKLIHWRSKEHNPEWPLYHYQTPVQWSSVERTLSTTRCTNIRGHKEPAATNTFSTTSADSGTNYGRVLVFDGYRYCRTNSSLNTKIYWRCTRQDCEETLILNFSNISNHPGMYVDNTITFQKTIDGQFIEDAKNIIWNDPSITIRHREVLLKGHYQSRDVPPLEEIKSQLQWTWSALCQPIWAQVANVQINGFWARSWNGNRRLLFTDNQIRAALFATDQLTNRERTQ